ncbi:ribonuclease HI family protein [Candidatus Daviesbacteria bacterium]|nr:ribonuclease HI family protein [Candidatus Daviesbacteria bacterium]
MKLIVNTDGASRGNPGPSSYGFIIKTHLGVILHQEGKTIGTATNNIAEYVAVLKALEYIKTYFSRKAPHEVKIISDSQLITKQLSGVYKIKNLKLKEYFSKIKEVEENLGVISYKNVPRRENFIADRLANKALDEYS